MKSQYGAIIEAKMLVIDEILNFDSSQNKTHNDWQVMRDLESFLENSKLYCQKI